nr:hypothetical protein [uncultured Pedobacter sp.]
MKFIKKITVLFLSLMICYTSSGMNLFMHTCGGKLSKLSFSEADANCGMENSRLDYQAFCKSSLDNVDTCCKNHSLKSPHHNQIIEKADSQLTKNAWIFLPTQFLGLQYLIDHNFKLTDVISPHLKQPVYINPKIDIYVLLQNFRN